MPSPTYYPNTTRSITDFLTVDFRMVSEQIASILAVQFRQKYKLWNDQYSLVNFNAPAWKSQWRAPDQTIPGMLSFPYAGFNLGKIELPKEQGFMDNHNAVYPIFPGKTWLNFDELDLPTVIRDKHNFSVHYYDNLLTINHKWYVRSLTNRKYEFEMLYRQSPQFFMVRDIPIRITLPPEFVTLLMKMTGTASPGELLAYIRLRSFPLTPAFRPGLELVYWGGKPWLNIIHHIEAMRVGKSEECGSETITQNGTYLSWKGEFDTETIIAVPFRYILVETNPLPRQEVQTALNTLDVGMIIPSLAFDLIDYSKTDYKADFIRLTTIHAERFVPAEMIGLDVPGNLLGGNIAHYVSSNTEISDPADFGHWHIMSGNCTPSISSDPLTNMPCLALTNTSGSRVLAVLETRVLNELPQKGEMLTCTIQASGSGGMIAIYPGEVSPSGQGRLTLAVGEYSQDYRCTSRMESARIMAIIPAYSVVKIYHASIFRRASPGMRFDLSSTFPPDYQRLVKWLISIGENINNNLIVGIFNNKGYTYTTEEYDINWETMTLTINTLHDPAQPHHLLIKATERFEDRYRQLGVNAALPEGRLLPGDITARI